MTTAISSVFGTFDKLDNREMHGGEIKHLDLRTVI